MLGCVNYLPDAAVLNDPSGVHHGHVIAVFRNDPQIVGNQEHCGAGFSDEVFQEIEDLRLDGDIKSCRRLVRDQDIRFAAQHHRNHDALPHAPGQLVTVGVPDTGSAANPNPTKQLQPSFSRFSLAYP